jgi:16S rRNA (guanine527-N7)-methyltransferase
MSDVAGRLARYGELLLLRNQEFNLTGARDADAIAAQIADALTLLPLLQDAGELIDVGTGGGLPAVPLAIARGMRVTLVDATAKKITFVSSVIAELGIEGEAIAARAETLARDARFRDRFTYATARAVASAPAVIELTLPFLAPGGRALLQRGAAASAEHDAARETALALGGEVTAELPLEGERRILIVTKRSPTPARFPRRVGVAQKRPLFS